MRLTESNCDVSERITRSPAFNPSRISISVTELRPSLTCARTAPRPPSTYLKIVIELCSWPNAGRCIWIGHASEVGAERHLLADLHDHFMHHAVETGADFQR